MIAIEILGGLSLLGLLLSLRSRGAPNFLYLLCLLLSLGVGGVMAYTANLGGQVRHTEIRPDFMPLPASPPAEKDD